MKVTITTPFARLSVEMDPMQAASLVSDTLRKALPKPITASAPDTAWTPKYPLEYEVQGQQEETVEDDLMVDEDPDPAEALTVDVYADHDDDYDSDEEPDKPVGFSAEEPTPDKGYKGFLHIKCSHCHKEKSFAMKYPLKKYNCECGETTPLKGLTKVVAKCDCGCDMRYFTNQDADSFEINCINCKTPVLVQWSFRNKRYENPR